MGDLKEKIEEIVNKVKSDPDFATKFQENPVTALEGVLGMIYQMIKSTKLLMLLKQK